MKLLILLAFILCCPVGQVAAQAKTPGEVLTEYDRFEDQTTVRIRVMPVLVGDPELSFSLITGFAGRTVPVPTIIRLQFLTVTSRPYLQIDRRLVLLVDGERIRMNPLSLDSAERLPNGYLLESASQMIPFSLAVKLANAKIVEGKLGQLEFEVKPEFIASLKRFVIAATP